MGENIVIAGETFSSNLGDGIIADTMSYIIREIVPQQKTVKLDISGRLDFSKSQHRLSTDKLRKSKKYFESWQELAKWKLVRRRRCEGVWQPILQNASKLIIGGGQLLMDNALNFPLKIHHLANVAWAQDIPFHFFSCGVGSTWSRGAANRFEDALRRARSISVRDTVSAKRLERFVSIPQHVTVTSDPAVWASDVYGRVRCDRDTTNLIGLGVISPEEIRRRLLKDGNSWDEGEWLKFWADLISILHKQNKEVELFVNGSRADFEFACQIEAYLKDKSMFCHVSSCPITPKMLARKISGYSGIIASRLHANIVSFSYGIPTVGLVWDDKVKAFYQETHRHDLCKSVFKADAEEIASLLDWATSLGIDASIVASQKAKALTTMKRICDL